MSTRDQESHRTEDKAVEHNPCRDCGACCSAFRVSFYWAEADDATGGGVPVRLTVRANGLRRAMRYTDARSRRCIALRGTTGRRVLCNIYERRPSVCRNFEPSWKAGSPNDLCDKARAFFGLPPLPPDA